jgi:hypothetical protein
VIHEPGLDNRAQTAGQATRGFGLLIRQRRRTIHQHLTRHTKIPGSSSKSGSLAALKLRQQPLSSLKPNRQLNSLRLPRRVPALHMNLLMSNSAPLLHLVQPVINPNIDPISA